jgi:hypothetical protein
VQDSVPVICVWHNQTLYSKSTFLQKAVYVQFEEKRQREALGRKLNQFKRAVPLPPEPGQPVMQPTLLKGYMAKGQEIAKLLMNWRTIVAILGDGPNSSVKDIKIFHGRVQDFMLNYCTYLQGPDGEQPQFDNLSVPLRLEPELTLTVQTPFIPADIKKEACRGDSADE